MAKWIEEVFDNASPGNYRVTSQETYDYNCIAWAAGKTDRPWWPIDLAPYYWPPGLPKKATVRNFVRAFKLLGYKRCKGPEPELGYEKVAIYESFFEPLHAARQLNTGAWTSKLGKDEDIEHATVHVLEGDNYGRAVVFLKRPIGYHPTWLSKIRNCVICLFAKVDVLPL